MNYVLHNSLHDHVAGVRIQGAKQVCEALDVSSTYANAGDQEMAVPITADRKLACPSQVMAMASYPGGEALVSGHLDGSLALWVRQSKPVNSTEPTLQYNKQLVVEWDGADDVSLSNELRKKRKRRKGEVNEIDTEAEHQEITRQVLKSMRTTSCVRAVDWFEEGEVSQEKKQRDVAVGYKDGRLRVYRFYDLNCSERMHALLATSSDSDCAPVTTLCTFRINESGKLVEQTLQKDQKSLEKATTTGTSYLFRAFLSGHEDGSVRVWKAEWRQEASELIEDSRLPLELTCVAEFKEHEDYIACFLCIAGSQFGEYSIVAAGGDGVLSFYSLSASVSQLVDKNPGRTSSQLSKPQLKLKVTFSQKSEQEETGFSSMCSIKGGKRLVVGAEDGSLYSFTTSGSFLAKYGGHPSSIDSLVKLDEDTVLTGSFDGMIRLIGIKPNQFLAALDTTTDHENMPIESLLLCTPPELLLDAGLGSTQDPVLLATTTHDEFIRLYDLRSFLRDDNSEVDSEAESKQSKDSESNSVESEPESQQAAVSSESKEESQSQKETASGRQTNANPAVVQNLCQNQQEEDFFADM